MYQVVIGYQNRDMIGRILSEIVSLHILFFTS